MMIIAWRGNFVAALPAKPGEYSFQGFYFEGLALIDTGHFFHTSLTQLRKVVIEGMAAADKPCPQLQPSLDPMPSFFRHTLRSRNQNLNLF